MHAQPDFTEAEWAVIIDLLEREQADLPAEIRHTRTASVRDDLRERLRMVRSMLERFQSAAMA